MVARGTRVNLHHQPVGEAHPRHFRQHLRPEGLGVGERGRAGPHAAIERGRVFGREVGGLRGRVAVVGRGAADRLEIGAARRERGEVVFEAREIAIRYPREGGEIVAKARKSGIDDGIGAEGGQDPAAPAARLDAFMPLEVVERTVGGGQRLDLEALEQGAGPEFRPLQAGRDMIVDPVAAFLRQPLGDAEDFGEGVVQPQPRGRAAEQLEVLGENPPDLSRVGLDRAAVDSGHADLLGADSLAVEHAVDIVVRDDEEPRRIGERRVLREPARIGVAVRAHDRQVFDGPVKLARHVPHRGLRWEQAVGMKREARSLNGHGFPPAGKSRRSRQFRTRHSLLLV